MDIGSKVVCIDDSVKPEFQQDRYKLFQVWVKKDKIYTIREFLENDGIVVGVLLEEIRNNKIYQPLLNRYQEVAFGLFRFREIEKPKVEYLEEVFEYVER